MRILNRLMAMALAVLAAPAFAQSNYPSEPLRIIVPTDPGGSVDSLARIYQRGIEEMGVFPSVVIINQPGAGGTVGTRALQDAKPDGYTIAIWTSGLITSKAMGVVDYDHTAFKVLGGVGQTEIGLGVLDSSRFASVQDMIAAAKEAPDSVTVATNIGLPVFFTPLMFAKGADVEMKFVQIGGGAKRLASILGGHTDTGMFSVSEFQQYADSGLRPIVLFSKERTPSLPDVPTATEVGVDLVMTEPRVWLAPAGIGDAEAAKLSEVLKAVTENPDIVSELQGQGFESDWYDPDSVKAQLDEVATRTEPLAEFARGMASN